MKKLLLAVLVLAVLGSIPAGAARQNEDRDIVDTMMSVTRFDTFLMLLRESDL